MDIATISELLNAKVVCGDSHHRKIVEKAFSSDLMSDVLTQSVDGMLLMTGLATLQTIRTAEMSDIQFVVFVRNKKATEEMIELANENEIVLLETEFSMYKSSGILYKAGLDPIF